MFVFYELRMIFTFAYGYVLNSYISTHIISSILLLGLLSVKYFYLPSVEKLANPWVRSMVCNLFCGANVSLVEMKG